MHAITPTRQLCAAALSTLAFCFLQSPAHGSPAGDFTLETRDKIVLQAQPFALTEVRILDGPFKHAEDMDRAYLLSLDVDRLLHTFRLNAGLPSSAKPYGGWEEPKGELRGHFAGHYLSACALMYASTGDEKLKQKGEALVAGMAECQAKFPSGYLSAYPEEFFDRVEKRVRVWAPYYTLHKIFAGLLDMYVLCGDQQALDVAKKFGDWAIERNARLTDPVMQAMLGTEHGGMNESFANLYALTGEEKYLQISKRFNHLAVIDPATRRQDKLTGLHANTQIPKFIGTARQYELTGDDSLKTASVFFWNTVVKERSYVIGGHSDGEMFSPKEKLSTAFGPSTTETCNSYNMLKLTRHLFCWDPQVEYADYYERALYNHILASQNPANGMTCYYVPLAPGSHKTYSDHDDSFWCCTGTGVENHGKYGDSIYFHGGDSTLYVNLFIASDLNWRTRGIKVHQETTFPTSDRTKLTFSCEKPEVLEVKLRWPSWAKSGFEVTVNGDREKLTGTPCSWVTLNRTWKSGDTVSVKMPLSARIEGFADNPDRFAFLNGPIVLCAQVDASKPFPAVVAPLNEVVKALKPTGKPNTFATSKEVFRAPGTTGGVTLEPFYAMHGDRSYVVYFDRFTPTQWKEKEADYAVELARQREFAARTVDFVVPDNEQSERDHVMQGEKTSAGDLGDRKWRHATDGGWFSWQLKVQAERPQELWVTYWGGDGGNRTFDILVDGQKIATQKLENNKPGQFYDAVYPLPAALLKGKQTISVKFQAQPGMWAGGVFGVRVMKAATKDSASTQATSGANLALVATTSTSYVSGHETLSALNDGFTPDNSNDKSHGAYGNWPQHGRQWVQYDWSQPISIGGMEVYWFDDHGGVRLPKSCLLKYWDGGAFVSVSNASGLGMAENCFNTTTFPELTTTKLRLEFEGNGDSSTGLLEWRVQDSGKSPNFPPTVNAGVDRVVILGGPTYLSGRVKDDGKPKTAPVLQWSKDSGPGSVTFADSKAVETTARFSKVGDYVLKLTADDGELNGAGTLHVSVTALPPAEHLEQVWPTTYQLTSPFWRNRIKNVIVNWIPHCVQKIEDPLNKEGEGGIENFVQAGRKLAGAKDARHVGAVFANTWVYNTLESMCVALLVDPQGDPQITAAQEAMRTTLEDWIPKMLSAQEPDGYLHTQYTIEGHPRWSNKSDHEGYQAGYFMEAAMAHYLMTGGKDKRMIDAARRLADCWVRNIGPAPKHAWYDGHQELEQALMKLARFVEQTDGAGAGKKYVELAKFLLDSRKGGDEYDQSHTPVTRQYEASGHAVRAVYSYSGMADVAMETRDVDYLSAVQSLWNNIVNRKYYITGGMGSGETSEGFGKNYSLPNSAYSESCANCGELFLQHKLQMIYHDARYADLAEETLYNAILGDLDLEAQNYTYTNPLDSSEHRYKWHVCPCCVGNIPRTLLQLPTWTYTTGKNELYVNLFIGSTVTLDHVAGTSVQLIQTTDYPWSGKVSLIVNPAAAKKFALKIRVPNRQVSNLYTSVPNVDGLVSLAVNGKPVKIEMESGYAVIKHTWEKGDKVEWEVPMKIQRVKADTQIVADRGRVALRYGPLIYNLESVDQNLESVLSPSAPLSAEWKGDLLDGVIAVKGEFTDGKPLLAIPNYSRLNRGGRSIVWVKDK